MMDDIWSNNNRNIMSPVLKVGEQFFFDNEIYFISKIKATLIIYKKHLRNPML